MTTRSLLPAALLLFGCSLRHKPMAPEPARGPARDSLFHLDQSRGDSTAARGDVDGVLALFAPDVVFLRAGVPAAYGREAARAILAAARSDARTVWQPLGGGVSNDLRNAYTYGIAANASASTARIRLERYVAYWTRERGAPWRIAAYAEVNGAEQGTEVALAPDQLVPPATTLSGDASKRIERIRAADSLFSDLADRLGTAYAFANTVAPDGVVFGPSQLVIGPKAIEAYFRAQASGTSLTWRPVFASVAASGDLGFTVGEWIRTGRGPSGAAVQRFGKYLTVWQRQPNGDWKFVVDGGNQTPKNDR